MDMVHVHGAIYKERELLTAEGKTIKNKREILDLLQAIWLLQEIAVIHRPGYKKGEDLISRGNNQADMASRRLPSIHQSSCCSYHQRQLTPTLSAFPANTDQELQRIHSCTNTRRKNGSGPPMNVSSSYQTLPLNYRTS